MTNVGNTNAAFMFLTRLWSDVDGSCCITGLVLDTGVHELGDVYPGVAVGGSNSLGNHPASDYLSING